MRHEITGKDLARYYRLGSLGLMALTALIYLAHGFLPEKRFTVWPTTQTESEVYGSADGEHGRAAYWINEQETHWACEQKPNNTCGWWVNLSATEAGAMDISGFDALEFVVSYQGPATRLRFLLRNDNPEYTTAEDGQSSKAMTMSLPASEAKETVRIALNEFSVASWWLHARKMHWQRTKPEFDAISTIGLDLMEGGVHEVRIDRIDLVGRWIKTEALLITLLSFWMSVFLLEGAVRFYRLYRTAQKNRQAIAQMEEKQRSLEDENKQLESVASTDPLTGINNRSGFKLRLDAHLQQHGSLDGLRIMILDIDHFKRLNDQYGHDMGDKVLKTFASLLAMNLREDDIFARLGGEEFVVVSRSQFQDGPQALAEKLRRLALQCTFNGDSDLHISVSIGVTVVADGEEITSALKRADVALYRAKQNGRNRIEYEGRA